MRAIISAFAMSIAASAPVAEQVQSLPNGETFKSPTYSGFLNITETKSLHYMFSTSMNETTRATDPVIIWFNGGPGCSSMLGFMQENGPQVIDDGEDFIKQNPYPWNGRANVIWLESPAGVGYSIAGSAEDWQQNDMTQSQDALAALKLWYEKYPEFKTNSLFVSGESYGGIYVPYLAWQIYQNNLQAAFDKSLFVMPLNGTMVGNGATDWDFDSMPTFPDTVFNFNLIPRRVLDTWNTNGCHLYFDDVYPATMPLKCKETWAQMENATKNLNWYDLYRPNIASALKTQDESRIGHAIVDGKIKTYKRGFTMKEYTPFLKRHMLMHQEDSMILGDFLTDYMNRADVRTAFHIPSSAPAWEMCSNKLQYHLQDEASLWIYGILQDKVKMMFYSGDTDGAIPTLGSKDWVKVLNRSVTEAWRPWTTKGEVSGYIERYDGLDFVTVKGVGHMAPQWARQPMYDMITAWTHGEPLPPQ